MMAQKVFAGHRFDLFEKILRTADPAEMKRLAGKDSFQEYAQICSFWEKNRKHTLRREGGRVFQIHPGHVATYMRGHLDTTARITPEESAEGILRVVLDTPHETCDRPLYLDYQGKELPW